MEKVYGKFCTNLSLLHIDVLAPQTHAAKQQTVSLPVSEVQNATFQIEIEKFFIRGGIFTDLAGRGGHEFLRSDSIGTWPKTFPSCWKELKNSLLRKNSSKEVQKKYPAFSHLQVVHKGRYNSSYKASR